MLSRTGRVAFWRLAWHKGLGSYPMFFSITGSGLLAPVVTLSGYGEVMLRCARIGYNP